MKNIALKFFQLSWVIAAIGVLYYLFINPTLSDFCKNNPELATCKGFKRGAIGSGSHVVRVKLNPPVVITPYLILKDIKKAKEYVVFEYTHRSTSQSPEQHLRRVKKIMLAYIINRSCEFNADMYYLIDMKVPALHVLYDSNRNTLHSIKSDDIDCK